jgi:hypothetical protein
MFMTFHHVKHAIVLSHVVIESEEASVDQAPEEEQTPVKVEYDICGSSGDPNFSANTSGKPRCMQTISLYFANGITL